MVLPKEWKELLGGEKVGFPRKVGLPQGVERSLSMGRRLVPWKGNLPRGDIVTRDDDVPRD
jgi:hypothetical protein